MAWNENDAPFFVDNILLVEPETSTTFSIYIEAYKDEKSILTRRYGIVKIYSTIQ